MAGGEDRAAPEGENAGAAVEGPSLQRLDPDRAAAAQERPDHAAPSVPSSPARAERAARAARAARAGRAAPPVAARSAPVIDTRSYKWMVGIFGLTLVLGLSVYQFVSRGVGNTGVTAGHRLHYFAAPLATSDLDGLANVRPTCSAARHDPRALNVCLLARRGPLVLSFFVTGAGQCVRQVSALQALTRRFPEVQFAAVAIGGSHRATAAAARAHRWTIPVAYDRDGRIGALYGVAACPMVELADRGGIVSDRLIGDRWQTAGALAPHVRGLVSTGSPAG